MNTTSSGETAFRPERAILELDARFWREAAPADFPRAVLRFRNQRWAAACGLGGLDEAAWAQHFARFAPLPGSLETPLALAYHGHQFGVYNPQIGDGRGFLFAQLRDDAGRLLDLGTKGSGQTAWSRDGDGRLTLKGGVREVLAASLLEALGVYTSKAFSLFETGEQLYRNDEPSPTRSSVLVRLSHSHVRFGTFQRLAHMGDADAMALLTDYCARHLHPVAQAPDTAEQAVAVFAEAVKASADMAAGWMSAGFVHGVLNTDNMTVTGESFDYGPWRFLPHSDPNFVAAYFDQSGLYRFGRQPAAAAWNLAQLGSSLSLIAPAEALQAELDRFEGAYREALRRRLLARFGLETGEMADDLAFLQDFFTWMTASRAPWEQVFHDWRGGAAAQARAADSPLAGLYADAAFAPLRSMLLSRPVLPGGDRVAPGGPVTLLVDDVEAIWDAIAREDDWGPFNAKLAAVEEVRRAHA